MYHLTCRWRIAIVFLLVPSLCVLLWLHTQSVAASRHLRQRPAQSQNAQIQSSGAKSNRGDKVEDFTAVVASLQKDDTEWLNELNWDVWKYEVDDPDAEHKTPINKGSEGMVYLTHIIDQYDNLTSKLIFLHPKRIQWHNDDPEYDGLNMLKNLQISYIDEVGYSSLRCHWYKGCPLALTPSPPPVSELATQVLSSTSLSDMIQPIDDDLSPEYSIQPPLPQAHASHTHNLHHPHIRSAPSQMDIVSTLYASTFSIFFPDTPLPSQVAHPCCAQFAVTRSVIHSRPKSDYVRIRQWLMDIGVEDAVTGRLMEYIWHILFGQEAVSCPDPATCYCKLYGRCDVKCTKTEGKEGEGYDESGSGVRNGLWKVKDGLRRSKGDCGVYTYPFGWDWFKSVVLWKIARVVGW